MLNGHDFGVLRFGCRFLYPAIIDVDPDTDGFPRRAHSRWWGYIVAPNGLPDLRYLAEDEGKQILIIKIKLAHAVAGEKMRGMNTCHTKGMERADNVAFTAKFSSET